MIDYFDKFGYITYDFTVKTDTTPQIETIVDILQRVQLNISASDIDKMCDTYIIPSGAKIEQVSQILYNTPFYHWVIMYINGITNRDSEWVMNEQALSTFITKKYGAGNENNIHHYESVPEGLYVDPVWYKSVYGVDADIITNTIYEENLNENKRFIKVIKTEYIQSFVTMFVATQNQ